MKYISSPECLAFASLNALTRGKLIADLGKFNSFEVERE
jgi:hypothetical protein